MARCSRITLACLLLITLIISIPCIFYAAVLHHLVPPKPCFKNITGMLLGMGVFVFVVSLMGLIGSLCKIRPLQSIFLLILTLATVVVFCFSMYIIMALPHDSASATQRKTENGYWLKEYSPSLQTALVNEKDWFGIKNCLTDVQFCDRIPGRNASVRSAPNMEQFYGFLQKGCCFPPNRCGLVEKNSTHWEVSKLGLASEDNECKAWSNIYNGKCYECDSCKAGYLAKFQQDWERAKAYNIGFSTFLILTTTLAWSAFSEDRKDGYRKHPANV